METQSASRNMVGPVIQAGEFADAIAEAIAIDNPGKQVSVRERASYVRIEVDAECILRRSTVQEVLGRPFRLSEIEQNMPSFSGQIDAGEEKIRFYFEKSL